MAQEQRVIDEDIIGNPGQVGGDMGYEEWRAPVNKSCASLLLCRREHLGRLRAKVVPGSGTSAGRHR